MSGREDYIAMVKAARGFSRHAVGYEKQAAQFPWRKDHLIHLAWKARRDARWFLEWARRQRDGDPDTGGAAR